MSKFEGMRSFVKVVEEGGFAAAGRSLGLSRSQVNRAVINLENELGVQLLHRTTRKVAPTASGQNFYNRCRIILSDYEEAEQEVTDVQSTPSGILRINGPMSFSPLYLGPTIVDFMLKYPEIKIILVLSDSFVDPVEEGFDMTIRISERNDQSALIDHEVIKMPLITCASPNFIKKYGTPTAPADLATLPCLYHGTVAEVRKWKFTSPDGEKSVRINGMLCSNSVEVLLDAAVKGLGVLRVAPFAIREKIEAKQLIPVLDTYQVPCKYLTLLYPPNRQNSVKLRLLIDFLYERFTDMEDFGET